MIDPIMESPEGHGIVTGSHRPAPFQEKTFESLGLVLCTDAGDLYDRDQRCRRLSWRPGSNPSLLERGVQQPVHGQPIVFAECLIEELPGPLGRESSDHELHA